MIKFDFGIYPYSCVCLHVTTVVIFCGQKWCFHHGAAGTLNPGGLAILMAAPSDSKVTLSQPVCTLISRRRWCK